MPDLNIAALGLLIALGALVVVVFLVGHLARLGAVPLLGALVMSVPDDDESKDSYRLGEAERRIKALRQDKADASDVADLVKTAAEDRKDLRIAIVDVATLKTTVAFGGMIGSLGGSLIVAVLAAAAAKIFGAW